MKTILPTLSKVVDSTTEIAYDGNFITNKIWDFNDFIKQLLELWMFIPCKDGVPLKEPEKYYGQGYNELNKEYQQALDRVIFKGFEILDDHKEDSILFPLKRGCIYYYTVEKTWRLNQNSIKTISDLEGKVDLTDKEYERLNLR